MEAEYILQALYTREALCVAKLMQYFGIFQEAIQIFGNNIGAMKLARDHKWTAKTKHIGVVYHITQNYVEKGIIILGYIQTTAMVADCMKKALPWIKLGANRLSMGLQICAKSEGEC